MTAIIACRGLTKLYRMGEIEVAALRGVDVELVEGELVVLLGASGSGKSTLLNFLGGLDVGTTGDVEFRGEDLTAADADDLTMYRRNHVGFVFRLPVYIAPSTYATGSAIALVSGLVSALLVRRRLDHLDLIGVLKSSD